MIRFADLHHSVWMSALIQQNSNCSSNSSLQCVTDPADALWKRSKTSSDFTVRNTQLCPGREKIDLIRLITFICCNRGFKGTVHNNTKLKSHPAFAGFPLVWMWLKRQDCSSRSQYSFLELLIQRESDRDIKKQRHFF